MRILLLAFLLALAVSLPAELIEYLNENSFPIRVINKENLQELNEYAAKASLPPFLPEQFLQGSCTAAIHVIDDQTGMPVPSYNIHGQVFFNPNFPGATALVQKIKEFIRAEAKDREEMEEAENEIKSIEEKIEEVIG